MRTMLMAAAAVAMLAALLPSPRLTAMSVPAAAS
jgi:hypothetical protein